MIDRMMTCDSVEELLPEILEGDLSAETGASVDAHISKCARCIALVRDVGSVRESAAALPDLTPSTDLWQGIAARIETPVLALGERKTKRFATPAWIAAAASLLIVASSGITYLITSRPAEPVTAAARVAVSSPLVEPEAEASIDSPVAVAAGEPDGGVRGLSRRLPTPSQSTGPVHLVSNRARRSTFAPDTMFISEIARLQRVIAERRNDLDPYTVSVVENNLKLIDLAIQSSRAALRKDPASGFLTEQLTRALDKKVDLLRTVALLPSST